MTPPSFILRWGDERSAIEAERELVVLDLRLLEFCCESSVREDDKPRCEGAVAPWRDLPDEMAAGAYVNS